PAQGAMHLDGDVDETAGNGAGPDRSHAWLPTIVVPRRVPEPPALSLRRCVATDRAVARRRPLRARNAGAPRSRGHRGAGGSRRTRGLLAPPPRPPWHPRSPP